MTCSHLSHAFRALTGWQRLIRFRRKETAELWNNGGEIEHISCIVFAQEEGEEIEHITCIVFAQEEHQMTAGSARFQRCHCSRLQRLGEPVSKYPGRNRQKSGTIKCYTIILLRHERAWPQSSLFVVCQPYFPRWTRGATDGFSVTSRWSLFRLIKPRSSAASHYTREKSWTSAQCS